MLVTAQTLVERYGGIEVQKIIDFSKMHLEDINGTGEHAKTKKGQWYFDEEAVQMLDAAFGYQPPQPEAEEANPEATNEAADASSKKLESQNKILQRQVEELTTAYQTSEEKNRELTKENKDLHDSLISLQDGRDSANTQMLRRANQRADRAEKLADSLQKKFNDLNKNKTSQSEKYEARISELQTKINELTETLAVKVKEDFMYSKQKEGEARLYAALNTTQQQVTDMQSSYEEERMRKEDAIAHIKNLQEAIDSAKRQLESIILQLDATHVDFDEEAEPADDAKAEGKAEEETDAKTSEEMKQDDERAIKDKLLKQQEAMREQILKEMLEEQEAKKTEEAPKKKTGFFSRIASLF